MRYNFNKDGKCKQITIPDSEIKNNMVLLGLTEQESIEMWLEDNGYLDNQEQVELDEKAKKVKIDHDARRRPHLRKRSPAQPRFLMKRKNYLLLLYRILTVRKVLNVKM